MRVRELSAILVCLVCVQCGSQSPSAPSRNAPATAVPGDPGPPAEPDTPPPPFVPNVLVGAGDIAMCDSPNPVATSRLLDSIGGTVIAVGDNAYPAGTERDYHDCYGPTWGRHKARTRPTPGNHEYESRDAAPYFDYFGDNAGRPGLGYYAFHAGSWRVISLNSNVSSESQVEWLSETLASNTTRCTLAFWHHPFYSSGPNPKIPYVRRLWELLYKNRAEVIVSAHDHLYERFMPQDDVGRPDLGRGIRQFVVGTGGAPFHRSREVMPNSEVLLYAHGVLKLTLLPDTYEWEFISVVGPGDSGTGQCH